MDKKNTFLTPINEKKLYSLPGLLQKPLKNNGYFLEILFHGLNYNAKRIKLYRPQYFIDVHKSEVFVVAKVWS
jgi:hypothetical protein